MSIIQILFQFILFKIILNQKCRKTTNLESNSFLLFGPEAEIEPESEQTTEEENCPENCKEVCNSDCTCDNSKNGFYGVYCNNPCLDENSEICDKHNGKCIKCNETFYLKENNCIKCNENCFDLKCEDETGICNECPPNKEGDFCEICKLENCENCDNNGTCIKCNETFYLKDNNCIKCNENCTDSKCEDETGKCNECPQK